MASVVGHAVSLLEGLYESAHILHAQLECIFLIFNKIAHSMFTPFIPLSEHIGCVGFPVKCRDPSDEFRFVDLSLHRHLKEDVEVV
jgi:hypothetical protein